MGKMNWTDEQLAAINIRNTDTLVSAAAGSGKTAVLVERVIQRITDPQTPVDIDRLLVVTFTNAAASQMKEKVSKALVSAIEKNPENMRLRQQLIMLGSAEINTVHSFCMNVIKDNFQKADLPYEFDIIQDTERKMLMEDSLDETFNEFYEDEEKCEAFIRFADSFSGRDDTTAAEIVLKLYEFLRSMPFYGDWLDKKTEELKFTNPDDTVWGRFIKSYALKMLECAESINEWLLSYLEENGEIFGVDVYYNAVAGDKDIIEQAKKSVNKGLDCSYRFFDELKFPAIGRKKADTDPECAEFVKTVRDNVKAIFKKLKEDVFYQSGDEIIEIADRCRPSLSVLADVVKTFDNKYSEKKQKKGVVDFSDLEHKCVEILTEFKDGEYVPSDAALKLREKYIEVFVDEYQDTNSLQELIISMVCKPARRFMVGDVKQSIYGFRNSKPQLFLDKYNNYAREEGFQNRRLLLSRNFRSASHILGFVNYIFSRLMCKPCGGLDYGDDEKLYFGGGYTNKDSTDVYVIDTDFYDDDMEKQEREAFVCASKIRKMVDSGYEIEENGTLRPCRYSDFTVLLRSVSRLTDIYRSVFESYNIPLYVEKGSSYFETPEIKLAVSLLKIIDNPRQDIHLIAVLRSHIFGFNDDMLVSVRFEDEKADYYTCLKLASEKGFKPAVRFFDCLNRWRDIARTSSVYTLTQHMLDECNMYVMFPEGAEKLRALADWAEKFGKTSYKGLFRFITYLQRQIDENEDIGGNGMPSVDCVTIMSIHKSKGLENNIVILSNAGAEFNLMDVRTRMIFDDELGIAADYADTENKILYATLAKNAAHIKVIDDCVSEELRLLYVALTRAKYKLIVIGSLRKFESHVQGLKASAVCTDKNGFSVYSALKIRNYLDWILSALIFHTDCKALHECGINIAEKIPADFDVNLIVNPEFEAVPEHIQPKIYDTAVNENYDNVKTVLEYEYPYASVCTIPSKLSVSEIKSKFYAEITDDGTVYYPRAIDSSVQLTPTPAFLSESGKLPASALGTAYHSILQYIDFSGNFDISSKLDSFAVDGVITHAEREAVDEDIIRRFLASDTCRDINNAESVYREYSFIIPFDSSKLFGGASETIVVQGIIDCVYKKDGEYYVVDYKSDSYSSSAEIADRYRTQLAVYSEAVERKFGRKPKACMLYMLRTGAVIMP